MSFTIRYDIAVDLFSPYGARGGAASHARTRSSMRLRTSYGCGFRRSLGPCIPVLKSSKGQYPQTMSTCHSAMALFKATVGHFRPSLVSPRPETVSSCSSS